DYSIDFTVAFVARLPDGVVLTSEAGPDQTVIDLSPQEGAAVWSEGFTAIDHTSGQTVIEGFRITGYPEHSAGIVLSDCSQVAIRNCVFESPVPADATVYRWGVYSEYTDLTVQDCTFLRNSAPSGAGIGHLGSLTVENCIFIECSNVSVRAGGLSTGSSLLVRNCVFRGGVSDLSGAGISASDMTEGVTVEGCIFEDMTTFAGTVNIVGSGANVITDCLFHNLNGGCASTSGGTVTMRGNTCSTIHFGGPAILVFAYADLVFENNIVSSTTVGPVVSFQGGPFTTNCNVFWDNAAGVGYPLSATDRIVDPQFCDEPAGDLALQATSPCLPPQSLGCGLIGALGQGCGTVSVAPRTWGKIKSDFRIGQEE
ncbi:right-handed parallel beta-helix repeat-containing protein, partial [bacterium]|nr:right-handed parallel beta-helix repeat-containing protein [bacterium]